MNEDVIGRTNAAKSDPIAGAVTIRITRSSRDKSNHNRKAVAKTKRRIEITVDRSRLIVLKRRTSGDPQLCPFCSQPNAMLTVDEAATIAGVTSRTIYSRAEAGGLHFVETAAGRLLICTNSILGT
jgi:hypothetical protein